MLHGMAYDTLCIIIYHIKMDTTERGVHSRGSQGR